MDQVLPQVKKKPSDFVFGKVIGEGSFSTVSYGLFLPARRYAYSGL